MKNNETRNLLPMNDFLAISKEFATEKKNYEKKNARNTALGVLVCFAIVTLAIYIGIVTWNILLAIILMIIFIAAFACFASYEDSKNKRKLDEYGAELYRKYINNKG